MLRRFSRAGFWIYEFRVPALLLAVTLLSGCLFDHSAEKIATHRKSGDPVGARKMALDILEADADHIDVWRELAACDVELARKAMDAREEALPLLGEAALICGAMTMHKQSKLDRAWTIVGLQTSTALARYAGTNTLVIKPNTFRMHSETITEGRMDAEDAMHDWIQFRSSLPDVPDSYYDPATIGAAVAKMGLLSGLIEHLPCDDPKLMAETVSKLDDTYVRATQHSNITLESIRVRGAAGKQSAVTVLEAAKADLESQGYFDLVTVQNQKLFE
jgi:hypothetical protein